MPTILTYNPDDITQVGWRIKAGPKRAIAERRSRWRGGRDGVRLTIYDDVRRPTPEYLDKLLSKL